MSKLTLDEAIKHCLEVAEENDLAAETYELLAENNHNAYERLTAETNSSRCAECAADHRQLAEWLTELKELRNSVGAEKHSDMKEALALIRTLKAELKELRERIQKAKSMILDYSYTVEVMCNKISGTIGCEKCTYYNPETHDCEVRTYIARTRAFAKGGKNDA